MYIYGHMALYLVYQSIQRGLNNWFINTKEVDRIKKKKNLNFRYKFISQWKLLYIVIYYSLNMRITDLKKLTYERKDCAKKQIM